MYHCNLRELKVPQETEKHLLKNIGPILAPIFSRVLVLEPVLFGTVRIPITRKLILCYFTQVRTHGEKIQRCHI